MFGQDSGGGLENGSIQSSLEKPNVPHQQDQDNQETMSKNLDDHSLNGDDSVQDVDIDIQVTKSDQEKISSELSSTPAPDGSGKNSYNGMGII